MSLERERKYIEFKRVEMAKIEMEFKIKEREADIQRLKENIECQNRRLKELAKELDLKE